MASSYLYETEDLFLDKLEELFESEDEDDCNDDVRECRYEQMAQRHYA